MFAVQRQAAHMNIGTRAVFAKDIGHMRSKWPSVSKRQQNPRTDLLGQLVPSGLKLLIRKRLLQCHRNTLPSSYYDASGALPHV